MVKTKIILKNKDEIIVSETTGDRIREELKNKFIEIPELNKLIIRSSEIKEILNFTERVRHPETFTNQLSSSHISMRLKEVRKMLEEKGLIKSK